MPINSFSPSFLRGAAPGLSRLAQAIGSGKDAYQDAYTKEELAQSRIGQAIASQHASQARADNQQEKTSILQRRPGIYEEQVANASGFDVPTVQAYRGKLAGNAPQVPMGPPTEDGQMGVGSFQVGPESRSKISLALQQFLPLVANTGDLKPDDLAQAAKGFGDIGLRDDVLAGRRTAADVGSAQRAIKGGDLFKQSANGSVIDPFSGETDQTSPIATATVDLKRAQAAKAERVPAPKAGSNTAIDRDRVAILSQELFGTREKMKTAQGADLTRLQGDEAAVVAELKRAGVKDLGQLAAPKPGKADKAAAAETAKAGDAQEVLHLLKDAEEQIDDATNSFTGNLIDQGARAVGYSTKGAQAAAKLKAIEGLLVSKMPKMSGPQSDKDVLLYRQMAGQIGDPTIPKETRKAAIATIRKINERYAGIAPSGPPVGQIEGGFRFKGGNPADPNAWEKVQ